MESEYKITEYTYRFLKEAEKVFHSGTRSGENRPERATKGRKVSDKEEYFLERNKTTFLGKFEAAERTAEEGARDG
ncbi:hypothetical protein RhiirA4_471051 [Rhizophagus irregularis]|uniref:Uncharacterized protein n=1 Tax=Rhizophagus irregularis TaxID=588596 RepID=A0A2I1H2C7_9GLOM|nr:hypothetical protein RhiirA4_471051 [Rhizophagus irregularis]